MHILKYTNMQVQNYKSIYKHASIQVAMYTTIIVWNYASMRVCKCVFLQVFKYAGIYWIKYVCFQTRESIPHCKYVSVQV